MLEKYSVFLSNPFYLLQLANLPLSIEKVYSIRLNILYRTPPESETAPVPNS